MKKDFLVVYGLQGHNVGIQFTAPISVDFSGAMNAQSKYSAIMDSIMEKHKLEDFTPRVFYHSDVVIKSICEI